MTLGYFPRAAANEGLDPLEEDAWSLLAVENKSKISVEFDGRGEFSNSFFLPSLNSSGISLARERDLHAIIYPRTTGASRYE